MLVISVVRTITGLNRPAAPDLRSGEQHGADGADRGGFGRRRDAAEDGAEHGEDEQKRRNQSRNKPARQSESVRGGWVRRHAGERFGKKIATAIR